MLPETGLEQDRGDLNGGVTGKPTRNRKRGIAVGKRNAAKRERTEWMKVNIVGPKLAKA